ncbi:MAG: AMIN domain-containing protein, partial [Geminicoccaceae bacterium]
MPAADAMAAGASVDGVRIARHGVATRVVIDLSGPVEFRHITLAQPPRLAIDLPEVTWTVADDPGAKATGLVQDVRFGQPRPGVSRIVVDVAQPFGIDRVFQLPPS